MPSAAELLVAGLNATLPEKLEKYIEHNLDTTCCITGERITSGIAWKRIIPSSTGEYLDLMHGMTFEYMSVPAAIAYKNSWNLGSRLIFEDGTMYHPYIGRESASKSERPYWSELVREIWPSRRGQNCLCIFAGDFKKRVWNHARVGPLGRSTSVYLLDPDRHVSQNLIVDWQKLINTLNFVEMVYSRGFSKKAIAENLCIHFSAISVDLIGALELEEELAHLRYEPEFEIAILIAQRKE